MIWLPFDCREDLSPRILRISWTHDCNNVSSLHYSDYPIGRFPPIYDVVLLDTLGKAFINRRKDELARENITFVAAHFEPLEKINKTISKIYVIGVQHFLDRAIKEIEEMDRNNEIIPHLDPEHVRHYTSDGSKEIVNQDAISLQFKQDNIIRQLQLLRGIIMPIISNGNAVIQQVDKIEAKIKGLFVEDVNE